MGLNDIMKLTLHQTYGTGGEPSQNDFFYLQETVEGGANTLTNAFYDTILPLINACQHGIMKNTRIRTINLFDLGDFNERTLSSTGTNADGGAEALPFFNAFNVTLRVSTRAVKPGSKRFSGLSEFHNAAGVLVGLDTQLPALLAALDDPLENEGLAATFRPIVVKRIEYTTSKGTQAYKLPETPEDAVYGFVQSAFCNMKVRHQDSRGNGR